MSILCAHCGQPIAGTTPNRDGERFYHGACYSLEFPPEHPEEWPKPLTLTPHRDDEWQDHHGR